MFTKASISDLSGEQDKEWEMGEHQKQGNSETGNVHSVTVCAVHVSETVQCVH